MKEKKEIEKQEEIKDDNKNKQSIFRFFVKMFLIFLSIDIFVMFFAALLTTSSSLYKYGSDLIMEMFYALAVLVVMLLFKNSYVFTEKRMKFKEGLKFAIPMIAVSVYYMVNSILHLSDFSVAKFLNIVVFCTFIGITEEFLCRGWLLNEFIERYSDNKKNVITSIILSALVFGFMHIMNLSSQSTFETILQIINATAMGVFLGSLYFKTRNIWLVIFLHAFYDFSIFLGEMDLIKDCTYNDPTLGVTVVTSIETLLLSLLWILSAILIIKKTNFPDKKASRKKSVNTLKLLIVLVFIAALLPYEKLIKEEYEDFEVCYSYSKMDMPSRYEIHLPKFDSYNIEKMIDSDETYMNFYNYRYVIYLVNGKVKMKNVNTNYEVTFGFDNVSDIQVYESDNKFILVFLSSDNESTIYYSDYIERMNMSDDDSYLDSIEGKFKKFELPEISQIGYITIDHNENIKYPFFGSTFFDYFIIKDGSLYLIEK